jgi:hypothetical protein
MIAKLKAALSSLWKRIKAFGGGPGPHRPS